MDNRCNLATAGPNKVTGKQRCAIGELQERRGKFPYPTFILSVMHVAFELQADSLKLKKAPPLPVTHRNPNLAHLQSAPARRVAAAAKRKHREQQLAAVANVIVCLGYRASIFSHAKSLYSLPNMEVWNVAHMEGLGAAKHLKLTLGVGLLSPHMSFENQQWDLEVSAVVDRVTEEMSLEVSHPRALHVHVLFESGFTLGQAQSLCQMYALDEIESVRRNENLRDLSTGDLLSMIGRTSSISELASLINPVIQDDNPVIIRSHLYKINLSQLSFRKITFNQHPSVLRGNAIVNWGRFVSEFAHSALSPQSVDILRLEPSLDVLFGSIIHADSLRLPLILVLCNNLQEFQDNP
ncbi:hypothetical protein DFJ58DRAFT_99606 [Suillus subalutaceus]|uniref:uncharacterized protein n=1 Tax=Suillus subalutaceus TaxID=48586 RepID=UPI001B871B58|nr:uncharacterized protein DFJ58DRAFT_99606 [Suillus subalutaceus]KAG1868339.1 hypothetical protein DFJ58DRAFT_99606 [Suillus subalutaceus]